MGAPISLDIAIAISSPRAFNPEMILLMTVFRSSMEDRDQTPNAVLAAFAAVSTSSAVPRLIVANASSVAGFITSSVSLPAGSTHSPLIKNLL